TAGGNRNKRFRHRGIGDAERVLRSASFCHPPVRHAVADMGGLADYPGAIRISQRPGFVYSTGAIAFPPRSGEPRVKLLLSFVAALFLGGSFVSTALLSRAIEPNPGPTDDAGKFDFTQPQSPPRPAPKWLKIIDQGANDPRLKGYFTPEGLKVEIVADAPVV